jgi:hypothetical protein
MEVGGDAGWLESDVDVDVNVDVVDVSVDVDTTGEAKNGIEAEMGWKTYGSSTTDLAGVSD